MVAPTTGENKRAYAIGPYKENERVDTICPYKENKRAYAIRPYKNNQINVTCRGVLQYAL